MQLVVLPICIVLFVFFAVRIIELDESLVGQPDREFLKELFSLSVLPYFLGFLVSLLASLSFMAKRLRDIGTSPWWTCLLFVPGLNLILLLMLFFVPTDEFKNDPIIGDRKRNIN